MTLPDSGYMVSDCYYTISVPGVMVQTLRMSFDQNQDGTLDSVMTDAMYALADFFAAQYPSIEVTLEKMYSGSKPEAIPYPRI